VDNHAGEGAPNGQPFVQQSAFIHHQGEAAMGHFEAAGFYHGYELLPEGIGMQEAEHFMMGSGEPHHRQGGIFPEFIKPDDAHHHQVQYAHHQPMETDN